MKSCKNLTNLKNLETARDLLNDQITAQEIICTQRYTQAKNKALDDFTAKSLLKRGFNHFFSSPSTKVQPTLALQVGYKAAKFLFGCRKRKR